jgi:hypothetical protein
MRFVKKQFHWKSTVVIYGAFCTNKKAPPGLGGATLFFPPRSHESFAMGGISYSTMNFPESAMDSSRKGSGSYNKKNP